MVVKATQYKISALAKRMHIVGAFNLVHEPGSIDDPLLIGYRVGRAFHMVGHKECKQ